MIKSKIIYWIGSSITIALFGVVILSCLLSLFGLSLAVITNLQLLGLIFTFSWLVNIFKGNEFSTKIKNDHKYVISELKDQFIDGLFTIVLLFILTLFL